MDLVKLLHVHRHSVDFFSYSGPSGILGSDGKQNTVARGREICCSQAPLVLMNRLNKTDSVVF